MRWEATARATSTMNQTTPGSVFARRPPGTQPKHDGGWIWSPAVRTNLAVGCASVVLIRSPSCLSVAAWATGLPLGFGLPSCSRSAWFGALAGLCRMLERRHLLLLLLPVGIGVCKHRCFPLHERMVRATRQPFRDANGSLLIHNAQHSPPPAPPPQKLSLASVMACGSLTALRLNPGDSPAWPLLAPNAASALRRRCSQYQPCCYCCGGCLASHPPRRHAVRRFGHWGSDWRWRRASLAVQQNRTHNESV